MHENLALTHIALAQADSAFAHYFRALSLWSTTDNRTGEAGALLRIAALYGAADRPDSARVYYAQSLLVARAAEARSVVTQALMELAMLERAQARPDSALAYLVLALPTVRTMNEALLEAWILEDIARLYQGLNQPDSALAFHFRSFRVRMATGDTSGAAATLKSIGWGHASGGRPDSAVAAFAQVLALQRDIEDQEGVVLTLTNLASLYHELGLSDSAFSHATQALAIARDVGNRRLEGGVLSNLASLYRERGELDSALAYWKHALFFERTSGSGYGEFLALRAIAAFYRGAYEPARLSSAVAYQDSAAGVLSLLVELSGGDQLRVRMADVHSLVFEEWARDWLNLAPEVGSTQSALAALSAVERGRAQALLRLIRSTARSRASLRATRRRPIVGAHLAAEGSELAEAVTRTGSAALSYLVTHDALFAWLLRPDGTIAVSRSDVTRANLEVAVAALRAALGADSDALRIRWALRELPNLESSSAPGIGVGTSRPTRDWELLASQLAEWLLPSVLLATVPPGTEIVIVPNGALHLVPFAVLPIDSAGEPLGLRHPIRYAPSLEIAAEGAAKPTRPARALLGEAIVVGNPSMPSFRSSGGVSSTLGSLDGAEAEAGWVAEHFAVQVVQADEATETLIKARLPTASVVHLATHGYAYASEARVRDSFVALAPTPGRDDGLLTVGEVLDDLPLLTAELVVLSACQTGLGDLTQAEGTLGLQRAFLAKGARSLLVSLWSVSDEATFLLMQRFYTHWLGGASKAEALQRAQTDVRSTRGFDHPRYWAAFQLVGAR